MKDVPHGTANGYGNYGCRCAPCTEAHRIACGLAQRARSRRLGRCTVKNCDGFQYAKALCKAHYYRQRNGKPLDAPLHRHPRAQIFDISVSRGAA